jgi:1-deoxy-D-xylulose 5-phosphate reductoisomerase
MMRAHACMHDARRSTRRQVVIHPQSIIHSMVETSDSSVLAQVRTVPSHASLDSSCVAVYPHRPRTHRISSTDGVA